MAHENVEVVRAFYEAWNGPDGRHAALAFIADDFEWVNPSYAVETGTRHGREGWSAAMDSLDGAFHFGISDPIEFRDLGDRVLCFTTFIAKTSPDGVAFTQDEPQLWTLRDGKIVRLEWFHDRREALEAVGLSE
ncbi:MAG: SnoaL-like domain [Thermoleophilaceae bacterium]|nr:SnoaL-like domain [Thermoleophilaceae bacterium]